MASLHEEVLAIARAAKAASASLAHKLGDERD